MPAAETYVIVGASLAGAKAARDPARRGLRRARSSSSARSTSGPTSGRRCPRTCCWARPSRDSVFVHEAGWYAEQQRGAAAGHPGHLASTGPTARCGWRTARRSATPGCCWPPAPRRAGCPVPGADLDGRAVPAHLADSAGPVGRAPAAAATVVIAGAGWIGLEAAAAARQAGCEVTIVEPEPDSAAPAGRARAGRGLRRPAPQPRRQVPARRGHQRAARRRRPAGGRGPPGGDLGRGRAARRRGGGRASAPRRTSAWPPTPGWRSTTAS